jgi:hypothetical protein
MRFCLIIALALLCVRELHCSTTHPRPNILGVNETYQNPNTYLLALPVEGQIIDERFTNIRFAPYNAAALFDESILFCGDVTDEFKGKNGTLVITYLTQASGMYRGIGCHKLVSVFELKYSEEK